MKYKTFLAAGLVSVAAAILFSIFAREMKYDVDEARFEELMIEPDAVVLDVRTASEYTRERIKGAFLIDIERPGFKEQAKRFNKRKIYLIYGESGTEGAEACEIMSELGFEKLYNLKNGFEGWKKRNKPVVK